VRRFHANFSYQAGTWTKPRRVIAKVEWHPGEVYPRVGFIVTNIRPAERVVALFARLPQPRTNESNTRDAI
jgi:Transposase DDE domain group 1